MDADMNAYVVLGGRLLETLDESRLGLWLSQGERLLGVGSDVVGSFGEEEDLDRMVGVSECAVSHVSRQEARSHEISRHDPWPSLDKPRESTWCCIIGHDSIMPRFFCRTQGEW